MCIALAVSLMHVKIKLLLRRGKKGHHPASSATAASFDDILSEKGDNAPELAWLHNVEVRSTWR